MAPLDGPTSLYYRVRDEVDDLMRRMKGRVLEDPRYAPDFDEEHVADLEVLYYFVRIEQEQHSKQMQRLEDTYLVEYQRLGDIQIYLRMWHDNVAPSLDKAELQRIARAEREGT